MPTEEGGFVIGGDDVEHEFTGAGWAGRQGGGEHAPRLRHGGAQIARAEEEPRGLQALHPGGHLVGGPQGAAGAAPSAGEDSGGSLVGADGGGGGLEGDEARALKRGAVVGVQRGDFVFEAGLGPDLTEGKGELAGG